MRCHYWFINSTTWTSVDCSVVFQGPARPLVTLSPLRRGSGDPCFVITRDGAIWKTSMMASGPVTARITTSARDVVDCEAWGDGAAEFADAVGALLGAADDATGFAPAEPMIAAALRHRVMLHPDAQLQGITADDRIEDIVRSVPVPRLA